VLTFLVSTHLDEGIQSFPEKKAPMGKTVIPTDMPMVGSTDLQLTNDFEQQWQGGTPVFLTFHKFYLAITSVVLTVLVYGLASVKGFLWTVSGIHCWVQTQDQVMAALIPYVRTKVLTQWKEASVSECHALL
jgi:hypothetical protein